MIGVRVTSVQRDKESQVSIKYSKDLGHAPRIFMPLSMLCPKCNTTLLMLVIPSSRREQVRKPKSGYLSF